MNKKYLAFFIFIIFTLNAKNVYCTKDSPEDIVRKFYTWYLKSNSNALFDDEIYMYIEKCAVKRYRTIFNRSMFGSDYFFHAQDFDTRWPETMIIQNSINIDNFIHVVTVCMDPESIKPHCLIVFLKKDQESYRITKTESVHRYF
jgi:hypothetical protein